MIEIKPGSEEIEYLKNKYNPEVKSFSWEFPNVDLPHPKKSQTGSAVLVITNKNRFIMIKKPYAHWGFPIARVVEEQVEAAALREAKSLGFKVEIEKMPAINIIEMKFKNDSMLSWFFIFKCKTEAGDDDIKIDESKMQDMKFFSGWDFFFDVNPVGFSSWAYEWTKMVLKEVGIIEKDTTQ